jgi:hypothetical protein
MDDVAPDGEPQPAQAAPTPAQADAELSRIAREAVHQAPDPRLDKQLARMGLLDTDEPVEPGSGRSTMSVDTSAAEVERLREELRRSRMNVWLLVAACAVLALAVVVLLIR